MAEQTLDQMLMQILGQMKESSPEVYDILQDAKQKGLSEWETFERLTQYLRENPLVAQDLTTSISTSLDSPNLIDGVVPRTTRSEHGMPRLNPLVEGALLERLQFDQDAPELRSGPAPKKGLPAVPVATQARNPVALGKMLKSAAKGTRTKLDKLSKAQRKLAADVAEGKPDALAILNRHGELAALQDPHLHADMILYGTQETDLPGYRRGELPAAVKVKAPSGSQLAKMSPKDQQENAWMFLSTSQGRRTAVPVIRGVVAGQLRKHGLMVTERDFDPTTKIAPVAVHEWCVQLSGKNSVQPAFSLVDLSARALAAGLLRELPKTKQPLGEMFLEILPLDQFKDHQVGWAARLLAEA